MKAIFLFLVLLNFGYLAWQSWIVPSKAPPPLLEAEGVPRLLLVGEDPNEPTFVAPYDPSALLTVAAAEPEAEESEDASTELTASDEEISAEIEDEPVASDAAAAPEIEVAVASVALQCVSLGPFLNLREATEASAKLLATGLQPSQRLSESQVWFGHWVHLPPQPSREEAVAIVEGLKTQGVTDIYIEPSGPMENSISLGVFSDRRHAETRAGRIRRLGISPQIRDRYRDSSVYWVDFAMPQGQVIDPADYQASPRRVLRIEGRSCPDDSTARS
ncbi:MAG: hypothetical protein KJO35_08715 [Gammaproteobacteria bacterium]|nr:hypothetical protein [Gammaproteobacteria bacterium]NNF67693.1 hypothetical protein [Gammaproteobacteria bacterium]